LIEDFIEAVRSGREPKCGGREGRRSVVLATAIYEASTRSGWTFPCSPDLMPCFICTTCGTQHADSNEPPSGCRICQDDRQYVGLGGQHWTTQDALAETHENHVEELEPGLWSVETRPAFGIGQRAHLLRHAGGTILWDCVSLIDQETADRIAELGGVDAIAVSHPHFYSSIVDWSEAFGGVPIYLHNDDARWVCRPDPRITFWAGRHVPGRRGRHAGPLRRALRRIDAAALGRRRGRPRRAARQRHGEGGLGSRVSQRDAQLPESHSSGARRRSVRWKPRSSRSLTTAFTAPGRDT
jgi:hypothetical protein